MVEEKGTQLYCVRVRFRFRVRVRLRVWMVADNMGYKGGERWHRRTEEQKDIAGGAIERYRREGKRERERR